MRIKTHQSLTFIWQNWKRNGKEFRTVLLFSSIDYTESMVRVLVLLQRYAESIEVIKRVCACHLQMCINASKLTPWLTLWGKLPSLLSSSPYCKSNCYILSSVSFVLDILAERLYTFISYECSIDLWRPIIPVDNSLCASDTKCQFFYVVNIGVAVRSL